MIASIAIPVTISTTGCLIFTFLSSPAFTWLHSVSSSRRVSCPLSTFTFPVSASAAHHSFTHYLPPPITLSFALYFSSGITTHNKSRLLVFDTLKDPRVRRVNLDVVNSAVCPCVTHTLTSVASFNLLDTTRRSWSELFEERSY